MELINNKKIKNITPKEKNKKKQKKKLNKKKCQTKENTGIQHPLYQWVE